MELGASRGYETESHKAFMRLSVLVIDVLVNFVATWHLARVLAPRSGVGGTWKAAGQISLLVLLQPALVLVDHGHFQVSRAHVHIAWPCLGGFPTVNLSDPCPALLDVAFSVSAASVQ